MGLTVRTLTIGRYVETRVNFPHSASLLYAANSKPVPPPLDTISTFANR
jgi:hypothetical protein